MYTHKSVASLSHNGCTIEVVKRNETPGDVVEWFCSVKLSEHDTMTTPCFRSRKKAIANGIEVANEWGLIEGESLLDKAKIHETIFLQGLRDRCFHRGGDNQRQTND